MKFPFFSFDIQRKKLKLQESRNPKEGRVNFWLNMAFEKNFLLKKVYVIFNEYYIM
jgi:hypothetical protein